jgi:signal transduction histidine kinase
MARSLRTRVLVGAVLGGVRLMVIGHLVSVWLLHHARFSPLVAHWTLLALVAAAFVVAGLLQLQRGMSPLATLRARLADVRSGRTRRLEGEIPDEVQPLVSDLNALLEHREETVRRALTGAGDLAHGLKTPLAVLTREADRAAAAGQHEIAAALRQQVDRMRRQVDYHLARARAAASGAAPGARCAVAPSAEALIRTLLRLHAGRGLTIEARVPAAHAVRGQREDLEEMLGNLLDNACSWARSRVTVASSLHDQRIVIVVDDDGPGLDPALRDAVLQRGVRADQAAPGTGFGLAIVRDLAELHGGAIVLDASPLGGLRARLELPAV